MHWQFVSPDKWPFDSEVAPATLVADVKLFLMQGAMEPRPLPYSTDPAHGHWTFWTRLLKPVPGAASEESQIKPGELPPGPWDPDLFQDNDGKVHLYWGSSNVYPLYAAQLDLKLSDASNNEGKRVAFATGPEALFTLNPAEHGWERFGEDHTVHRSSRISKAPERAIARMLIWNSIPQPVCDLSAMCTATSVRATSPLRTCVSSATRTVRHRRHSRLSLQSGFATRDADIAWSSGPVVVGYNVCWGLTKDRLHETYQRFADQPTTLTLRSLNKGVTCVVAIEALAEHGVSAPSQTATLSPILLRN